MQLNDAHISPSGTRYWRAGRGEPVVLIHGVGLDATMWQAQMTALAADYDVIAYDMLGHGESPLPAENATLDDYADQLATLLDELAVPAATVAGFSMGGLVARAFALRHPRHLRAMVVLSSVFDRNERQRSGVRQRLAQTLEQGPAANVDGALERWFSPAFRQAQPECIAAVRERVTSNHPDGYYRSYALFGTEDDFGADRLASIRVPVLVATGELDPGSTPDMAHKLARQLPDARVYILEGQRHMAPVEAADQVNDLLLDFLDTVHRPSLQKERLG
ncbi:alpha/beta fold hydrolase [Marinobacter sp. JSM 1782161]|uniref:alpha/beta fold hydrolase n=1 Tax=Marinobacter sp. JSM 1782161 TaxID=2685906 RepID=UPI001401DF15|nr:alpha/beta fold hydrolase [Marinobacter sp. JSM 1782161]